MTRNFWEGESLSQIPSYVNVASKNGPVPHSKAEVALVNAPFGEYVFCVMTKNQKDYRREYDNQGFVLLREISRILYTALNPVMSGFPTPTGSSTGENRKPPAYPAGGFSYQ